MILNLIVLVMFIKSSKMVFICTKEILLGVPWVSVKADVLTFSERTSFGRSILGVS